MKSILILLLLYLALAGSPVVIAGPSTTRAEIDYLLSYVEKSNAAFLRNGKEYTAKEGAEHLRAKLKQAGDRVKTTEDFIMGVASKSSLSGEPYLVRLPHEKEQPTGPWLTRLLVDYRAMH